MLIDLWRSFQASGFPFVSVRTTTIAEYRDTFENRASTTERGFKEPDNIFGSRQQMADIFVAY